MRFTKSYIARLTNDGYVKIDHDEIEKVIAGMERGSPIIVRQGVVNPSFIVGIMEDRDRIREWHEECNRGSGDGDKAREAGMRPLKNIFDGTTIALKMQQSAQLGTGSGGIGKGGGGSGYMSGIGSTTDMIISDKDLLN